MGYDDLLFMESDELGVEKIIKNKNFVTYFERIKGEKLKKLIDEEGDAWSVITEFFEEHPEVYFKLVYTNESGWIGGHYIFGIGDLYLLKDSDHEYRWSGPFKNFDDAFVATVIDECAKGDSGDWSEDVDVFFELKSNLPNEKLIKLCQGWRCKFKINDTKYIGNGKNIKIASGQ